MIRIEADPVSFSGGFSNPYPVNSHSRVIKMLDGKGGGKGTRLNAKVSSLKDISKAEKLVADFFGGVS